MNLPFQQKLIVSLCVSAAASIVSASPAIAAATDKAGMQTQTSNQQASRYIRASKMIGMNVKNAEGENLGEIKDLIVDVANARVYYAVLEFGGFLGLGEKLFAYPVRAFRIAADLDDLVLNVDDAKLKAAPGFARDNWPDWATYRSDVDRYHGATISLKSMPGQKLRRASELIGKDVNDRSGNDVGEIEDIVVNMGNGRIQYAVLEFDRSWNLNDTLLAVPMRAFTYPGDRDELVMNVDKSRLDTKRVFDKNRWPDLNDPKYVVDVDRYLVTVVTTAPAKGSASASASGASDTSVASPGGRSVRSDSGTGGNDPTGVRAARADRN